MTQEYVQATIATLDEMRGVRRKKQQLAENITDFTKKNLQGLDVQPYVDRRSVSLLYNGEKFAQLDKIQIWVINDETNMLLEVPLSIKKLYEQYTKENELLEALTEILLLCYKDDAIKQVPALKDLFAKTDEKLKEETERILTNWKSLKEDLASFLG